MPCHRLARRATDELSTHELTAYELSTDELTTYELSSARTIATVAEAALSTSTA